MWPNLRGIVYEPLHNKHRSMVIIRKWIGIVMCRRDTLLVPGVLRIPHSVQGKQLIFIFLRRSIHSPMDASPFVAAFHSLTLLDRQLPRLCRLLRRLISQQPLHFGLLLPNDGQFQLQLLHLPACSVQFTLQGSALVCQLTIG